MTKVVPFCKSGGRAWRWSHTPKWRMLQALMSCCILVHTGLPLSGKNIWKRIFFRPGERELGNVVDQGKFEKDLKSQGI